MRALSSRPKQVSGTTASNPDAAMDALARLVSSRERSEHEARTRLKDKGFSERTIELAITRAVACDLLDDERFARGSINDKLRAGWGMRRIEHELYRHGIRVQDIPGYPDDFVSDDDQVQNARRALDKHRSRSKNPREAAYRYLVSKGYSSSVVQEALALWQQDSS